MSNGTEKHLCITFFLISAIIIFYIICNSNKINEQFSSLPLEIKKGYSSQPLKIEDGYNSIPMRNEISNKPIILTKDQMDQVNEVKNLENKSNKKLEESNKFYYPRGNIDYEDYDLNFTTTNLYKGKDKAKKVETQVLDNGIVDNWDGYGNDDCKNAIDYDKCNKELKLPKVVPHYDAKLDNMEIMSYKINRVKKDITKKEDIKKKDVKLKSKENEDDLVNEEDKENEVKEINGNEDDLVNEDLEVSDIKANLEDDVSYKVIGNKKNNINSKKNINNKYLKKLERNLSNDEQNMVPSNNNDSYEDGEKCEMIRHEHKCDILRDGVEKLNDNGHVHNKRLVWNETFKEDCGDL